MVDPDVHVRGVGVIPTLGQGRVVVSNFFFLFGLKIGRGGGAGPSPGSVSSSISSFMYWQLRLGEHTSFSVFL